MFHNNSIVSNITVEDGRLLREVTYLCHDTVDYLATLPFPERVSFECHSICRALALAVPKLRLVDGCYLGLIPSRDEEDKLSFNLCEACHSWLMTPDDAIIDPYPVGYYSAGPIIMATKGPSKFFGSGLYLPDVGVTKEVSNRDLYRRSQTLYGYIMKAKEQKMADTSK